MTENQGYRVDLSYFLISDEKLFDFLEYRIILRLLLIIPHFL